MPAQRLDYQPARVEPYDIVAMSDGSGDLMLHAALCDEADANDAVTSQTVLKLFHMGPPLGRFRMACDAVGNAGLSPTQKKLVKDFIDEQREDKKAEKKRLHRLGVKWDAKSQYRIQPAATPPNRSCAVWRFSCVGFVLTAYSFARIRLLRKPFPLKTVEELKQLYPPEVCDQFDDADARQRIGIGAGDRWPIELVG